MLRTVTRDIHQHRVEARVKTERVASVLQFDVVALHIGSDLRQNAAERFGGKVFRKIQIGQRAGRGGQTRLVQHRHDLVNAHAGPGLIREAVILRGNQQHAGAVGVFDALHGGRRALNPARGDRVADKRTDLVRIGMFEHIRLGHDIWIVVVPDEVDLLHVLGDVQPELSLDGGLVIGTGRTLAFRLLSPVRVRRVLRIDPG